jgi:hypothetical protein
VMMGAVREFVQEKCHEAHAGMVSGNCAIPNQRAPSVSERVETSEQSAPLADARGWLRDNALACGWIGAAA